MTSFSFLCIACELGKSYGINEIKNRLQIEACISLDDDH